MSNRSSPQLLIEDMILSAEKIMRYTKNLTYNDFIHQDILQDAVIRNFEIIGEAANRLTDEFKNTHPKIDWQRLRGFRNRVVHDYAGTDYHIVWTIIENDLLNLIFLLKEIYNSK